MFLLATQDFNKYVEEVSARPEAVKQMAERLLNDGDALTYLAIALRRPAPESHERSLYNLYTAGSPPSEELLDSTDIITLPTAAGHT